MLRFVLIAATIATAGGARADDCAALGIPDPAAAEALCAELRNLASEGSTPRRLGGSSDSRDPVLDDWPEADLVQDAYRADPRKTLELIRRIKDAGGLTSE
jgi:hypothetical protein